MKARTTFKVNGATMGEIERHVGEVLTSLFSDPEPDVVVELDVSPLAETWGDTAPAQWTADVEVRS